MDTKQSHSEPKRRIFVAYRRLDGLDVAEWLRDALDEAEPRTDGTAGSGMDVYFDRAAPSAGDFLSISRPYLKSSKALILVCTPAARDRRAGTDFLHDEIDWWLRHRRTAPIVVDATGNGLSNVPPAIRARWPNSQLVECRPAMWAGDDATSRRRREQRCLEQIVRGIDISERGIRFEELQRLRRALVALAVLAVLLIGTSIKLAQVTRVATTKANDVLSLSAIQELKELVDRADTLWPPLPERVSAYEGWLADAKVLLDGTPTHPGLRDHEAKLAEIRQRALPRAPGRKEQDPTYDFADPQDRWWHAQLSQLVADLTALTDPRTGLDSDGTSEQHGWGVPKRYEFARTISERSETSPEARARWDEAIAAIAVAPEYGGLAMQPQVGLLPIGVDFDSGLWEFWHIQSGDEPQRESDGKLVRNPAMGVVLVLIPGGSFWMGAQGNDPAGRNYDPQALPDESPVHEVLLSPYFLSKYELTQDQWERFTATNPSANPPGTLMGRHSTTQLHPVENVNWDEAMQILPRLDLELPTEAQWECGARAGTDTPWCTGRERDTLIGAVNLADQTAARAGAPWPGIRDWPELDDGWEVHAPVGSLRPNAFGLYDVHGNVWEWCFDSMDPALYITDRPSTDPVSANIDEHGRSVRGGSYDDAAPASRSAGRIFIPPKYRDNDLGLRPARRLTRSP